MTAGSGSMVTITASPASRARVGVSATTNATGSPTKRTLSVGSAGRGGLRISVPSRFLKPMRQVSVPKPARLLERRSDVDVANDPMGVPAADDGRVDLTGQIDVVGKATLPLDQSRVFGTAHRLADPKSVKGQLLGGFSNIHEAHPFAGKHQGSNLRSVSAFRCAHVRKERGRKSSRQSCLSVVAPIPDNERPLGVPEQGGAHVCLLGCAIKN